MFRFRKETTPSRELGSPGLAPSGKRGQAEEALRQLQRGMRVIGNCNQILLRAANERNLLEEICRTACEDAGYRMAWVAYAEHDQAKSVRPVAWAGAEEGHLAISEVTWSDTELGRGPIGTAIRSGKSCRAQDIAIDLRMAPWREDALRRGYRSCIALPLKDEQAHVFGAFTIYSAEPNAFPSEEVQLLEVLAADLALGMVMLHDPAARTRVEQKVAFRNLVLNNLRQTVLLISDKRRFRYAHAAACNLLSYARAKLFGQGVPEMSPQFPAKSGSDHWRYLKVRRSKCSRRTQDGGVFPLGIGANFEHDRASSAAFVRGISGRTKVEEERSASLHFFASMDRVNRAMQGTNDFDQMMSDVLDAVLAIFHCDRAFLLYPCDPGAVFWFSPMERCQPEYPGLLELKLRVRTDPEAAKSFRLLLASDAPLRFGPQAPHPVSKVEECFAVKSALAMALHPKTGKAWKFGIHQCSQERVWTPEEERLFQEIGRRVSDGLTNLLAYRNLQESERRLREAQHLAQIGSWDVDLDNACVVVSEEAYRIFGLPVGKTVLGLEECHSLWAQRVHPEDYAKLHQAWLDVGSGKSPDSLDYRLIRPDGEERMIHAIAEYVRDASGRIRGRRGTIQDVTERKQIQEMQVAFARKLLAVREEEKRGLSAALHHGVGSMSVAVAARLSVAEQNLQKLQQRLSRNKERASQKQAQAALGALQAGRQLFQESVDGLRELAAKLRPPDLDLIGLAKALRQHLHCLVQFASLDAYFVDATHGCALPAETETVLFRCVQEGLNNVVKHSQARRARICLSVFRGSVQLSIADDGRGFDFAKTGSGMGLHLGLRATQEMVISLRGSFHISSKHGRGTLIVIRIPLSLAENRTRPQDAAFNEELPGIAP